MTTAAAHFASLAPVAAPASPAAVAALPRLRRGQRARVLRVGHEGELGERLMEMGLVAGTEVVLLRRGLWGGALQVGVRGYVLSLRDADAQGIDVMPLAG